MGDFSDLDLDEQIIVVIVLLIIAAIGLFVYTCSLAYTVFVVYKVYKYLDT